MGQLPPGAFFACLCLLFGRCRFHVFGPILGTLLLPKQRDRSAGLQAVRRVYKDGRASCVGARPICVHVAHSSLKKPISAALGEGVEMGGDMGEVSARSLPPFTKLGEGSCTDSKMKGCDGDSSPMRSQDEAS